MTFIEIILSVLSVAVAFCSYYISIKNKIEGKASEAINVAENTDLQGKEKMHIVVTQIYDIVPSVMKPIFTREVIERLVQTTFDKMVEFAKQRAKKYNEQGGANDGA